MYIRIANIVLTRQPELLLVSICPIGNRVSGSSNSLGLQIAADCNFCYLLVRSTECQRESGTGACASSVAFQRRIPRMQGPIEPIRPSICVPLAVDFSSAAVLHRGSAMGLVGLLSAPLFQGVPQGPWWA